MANFNFKNVYINDCYSIAGKNENNGNLKNIQIYINDYLFGERTFESAEVKMQKLVLSNLINKNGHPELLVGGELSNQLSITSTNLTNKGINFLGIYSACATFIEGLIMIFVGIATSISGDPMGTSLQALGENNAQYMAIANLEVSKMEKKKSNVKRNIAFALSTFSLLIGGILSIIVTFLI